MAWQMERAMALTEITGARMADLDNALEAIHYEPSRCTDLDIEDLQKIQQMVEMATTLAEKIAAKIEK